MLEDTDDDEPYGLLSREFMEARLPIGIKKLPLLGSYNGMTDPDDHIEDIDVLLDY